MLYPSFCRYIVVVTAKYKRIRAKLLRFTKERRVGVTKLPVSCNMNDAFKHSLSLFGEPATFLRSTAEKVFNYARVVTVFKYQTTK